MRRRNIYAVLATLAVVATIGLLEAASGTGALPSKAENRAVVVRGHRHSQRSLATERRAAAEVLLRRSRWRRVDRKLVRAFTMLRAGHARGHAASVATADIVAEALSGLAEMGSDQGAIPSEAGGTTIGPGRVAVWLVPGSRGACLVDVEGPQGAGGDCNSASVVEAGGLWTVDTIPYGSGGAPTEILIGAAPNGNQTVSVNWSDGTTQSVPVAHNVYSVPIGAHPGWTSVGLKAANGTVESVTGMAKLP